MAAPDTRSDFVAVLGGSGGRGDGVGISRISRPGYHGPD